MAKILFECSDREKELWVEASGGKRKLSAWIRDQLNAGLAGEEDVEKAPRLDGALGTITPGARQDRSSSAASLEERGFDLPAPILAPLVRTAYADVAPRDLDRREVTPDPRPPSSRNTR